MFLEDQPVYPRDFKTYDPEFGFRSDYKGLGVFLYRSERDKRWYVVAVQNKGLATITEGRSFESLITAKNSCEFEMNQEERGGIRIKVLMDYIYLFKRDANGDPSYQKCSVNQIKHPNLHYMEISTNNKAEVDRNSNIDIEGIFFKNFDATKYTDEKALEVERLELSAETKNIQKLDDGTYHPLDLMAHKIQVHIEEENRKSLSFLLDSDSRFNILYKHYETLVSYNYAFKELMNKILEYRRQEEMESHWLSKTSELAGVQTELDMIHYKSSMFVAHYNQIKLTVMGTFNT